ncbi:unnamed protein product [Sphagnum balticum]
MQLPNGSQAAAAAVSSSPTSPQQQQQTASSPALPPLLIKDLRPSLSTNFSVTFIVLEKGSPTRVGEGLMCVALVADASASVHLQLLGNECEAFQPGDIVRLSGGLFSFHKLNLVLRAGKKGTLEKIGEFTMVFSENINMSKIQWVPDPANPKVWNPVGLNQGPGGPLSNSRGTYHQ